MAIELLGSQEDEVVSGIPRAPQFVAVPRSDMCFFCIKSCPELLAVMVFRLFRFSRYCATAEGFRENQGRLGIFIIHGHLFIQ